MIITLTPNTGIDLTLQLPSFQLNSTIRATDFAWGMGGKPIDVSWILGKLGIPTLALGFAAGQIGVRMEKMLRKVGVETDFVWVDGETRLNTVVVVPGEGQSTITSSSLKVSSQHLAEFATRYQRLLRDASCVVMGGSLPMGVSIDFYAEAIAQAHTYKVPVIFDSSGPPLLTGVKNRPALIKPNLAELKDLIGYIPSSRQEIQYAARKFVEQFDVNIIVTLGEDGAVAVVEDDAYFIHPLSIAVISSAGAGDGVLAGMALAYLRNESLEYGLRQGFALAAAILKTLGTSDFQVQDYQEFLPQIVIEALEVT